MKLLIITQKVDNNDPILGFFHGWLKAFSGRFEVLTVICLGQGKFDLPANVKVLTLGKEVGVSKLTYICRFYAYIWRERRNYDAVFVHMNQEYVLLGSVCWFLMGKRIYMWRNHPDGTVLTSLAALFSRKVFYTSPKSYTARFNSPRRSLWRSAGKAVQMPVGIDTSFFRPDPSVVRIPGSVLFLGRVSPIKKVLEFMDWVETTDYTATIAGPIGDKEYGDKMMKRLSDKIKYVGPVNQNEALKLFQTHEIYVNKTPAGSFDKTIVEAAAAGCKLMVDNPAAQAINPQEHSLDRLVEKLAKELS